MIAFVIVNVATIIVVKTNNPEETIISSEDVAISAKNITSTLPPQIRLDKRIAFLDGLNFFKKLNNKTHGMT